MAFATPAPLDYWEKSAPTWDKMRDHRKIVVSAQNEGDGRTHSKGAGFVKASVSDVWNFVTDTEKVKATSRFLKNFTWDQKTGAVDMQIEMLYVKYRLRGKAIPRPDADNPKITFEVYEGELVPFTAELEIRSAKAQREREGAPPFPEGQTLVRLSGVSSQDRALSWPLRVALEVVLQRTAGYLREAVESEVGARGSSK